MISESVMTALLRLRAGKPLDRGMQKRLIEKKLAEISAERTVITHAGKMVLQAYALGRRRWGAR